MSLWSGCAGTVSILTAPATGLYPGERGPEGRAAANWLACRAVDYFYTASWGADGSSLALRVRRDRSVGSPPFLFFIFYFYFYFYFFILSV